MDSDTRFARTATADWLGNKAPTRSKNVAYERIEMMQKFKVTGADRGTGEARHVVITAADDRDAADQAMTQHGLLVSRVEVDHSGSSRSGSVVFADIDHKKLRDTIAWGVCLGIFAAMLIGGLISVAISLAVFTLGSPIG